VISKKINDIIDREDQIMYETKSHKLYIHKDFEKRLSQPDIFERKSHVEWLKLQLTISGKTPIFKGTTGHEYLWRRSPIKGCHYYLWWLPSGVKGTKELTNETAIFIRDIRHHDENRKHLEVGKIEHYQEIYFSEIDPRDEEQKKIAQQKYGQKIEVKTVNGFPGSGKTLALQYATKELSYNNDQEVLYITYTSGLKNEARIFFDAYEMSSQIKIYTLNELESLIIEEEKINRKNSLDGDFQYFSQFLEQHKNRFQNRLGEWEQDPRMLWIEIRAYLLGMSLPFSWQRGGIGEINSNSLILNKEIYKKIRKNFLNDQALEIAYKVASLINHNQTNKEKLFIDQYKVKKALEILNKISLKLFNNLRGIIVDEIQDLTLLQIALLIKIGKISLEKNKDFTFILAGDESQTLYPSGFDWGITKDLFKNQLNINPQNYQLIEQKRSPVNLENLINNSWGLYKKYSEYDIPKSKKKTELKNDDEGELFRWKVNQNLNWNEVLKELEQYSNLALIDLNHYSFFAQINLSNESKNIIKINKYKTNSIKGLERQIILVFGLNEALKQLEKNYEQYKKKKNKVAILQNRNLIDEIRVALSRSIHTLIIVEVEDGVIENDLFNNTNPEIVDWHTLKNKLSIHNEDIDLLEKINFHLNSAEEAINFKEYEKAKLNNQKVLEIYRDNNIEDEVIKEQINKQEYKISFVLAEHFLERAEKCILGGTFLKAKSYQNEAKKLILEIDDSELFDQLESIKNTLELQDIFNKFEGYLNNFVNVVCKEEYQEFIEIYEKYVGQFVQTINKINIDSLKKDSQKKWTNLENKKVYHNETTLDSVAKGLWYKAERFKVEKNWNEYIITLNQFILIRQKQNKYSKALEILYKRYQELPPPINLSKDEVYKLINYGIEYANNLTQVNDYSKKLIIEWIREICEVLEQNNQIFIECYENIKEKIIKNQTVEFLQSNDYIFNSFLKISREVGDIKITEELCNLFNQNIPLEIQQIQKDIEDLQRTLNIFKMKYDTMLKTQHYINLSDNEKQNIKNMLLLSIAIS
jgi:hypothetical protein